MAMVWHLRVADVRFHQFRLVMVVPRESQHGQQSTLVALGSELWGIHFPFAVDHLYSECVRRCVDGSLWQVHVRWSCLNCIVIRLHMVVTPVAGSEKGFMNDN